MLLHFLRALFQLPLHLFQPYFLRLQLALPSEDPLDPFLDLLDQLLALDTRSICLRLAGTYSTDDLLTFRDSNGDLLPFHHQDTQLLFPSRNSLLNSDLDILPREMLLLLLDLRYESLEGRNFLVLLVEECR